MKTAKSVLTLLAAVLLAPGCGGGGGGGDNGNVGFSPAPQNPPGFSTGVFPPSDQFKNLCAAPRTGGGFPDMQGTRTDENNWLRSWSNELYLWYAEIVDRDPAAFTTPAYFDLMKTTAVTASGNPKDRFHFTLPTDEWIAQSQSGQAAGYGARIALVSAVPPRQIVVAFTEPGTPAAAAGVERGAEVLEADGLVVATTTDVDGLNDALFPEAGSTHTFLIRDLGATTPRSVTLTAQIVTSDPVNAVVVEQTPTGAVGYLSFTQHIAPAEAELIDAIETLRAAAVTDLILDLRYNRGGFLDIANELAFMVAGPGAASGRVFEELEFNDKHTTFNPVTGQVLEPVFFHSTSQGFSAGTGNPLPFLSLPRVYVISGAETCSASETILNSLRGIDIEVILIGAGTCGKPYGFYAFDNCGTTYFSIQFRGVNAKGFGDYPDGFSPGASGVMLPGCTVADDFSRALGDPLEARFAAALELRASGSCPVSALASTTRRVLRKAPAADAVRDRWLPGAVQR